MKKATGRVWSSFWEGFGEGFGRVLEALGSSWAVFGRFLVVWKVLLGRLGADLKLIWGRFVVNFQLRVGLEKLL